MKSRIAWAVFVLIVVAAIIIDVRHTNAGQYNITNAITITGTGSTTSCDTSLGFLPAGNSAVAKTLYYYDNTTSGNIKIHVGTKSAPATFTPPNVLWTASTAASGTTGALYPPTNAGGGAVLYDPYGTQFCISVEGAATSTAISLKAKVMYETQPNY